MTYNKRSKFISDTPDTATLKAGHCSTELMQSLDAMRETGELCDATIIVGTAIFKAHKLVLGSLSNTLKVRQIVEVLVEPFVMFYGDFEESIESTARFDHMESSVVKMVLDYLYSVEIQVTESNVEALLQAASFFQI